MGRARVGGVLLDLAPLRHDRDFRLIWAGQVVSSVGTNITRIALPFQVYVLTGSTLAVAALTAVQLAAILLFAVVAGSLADALDRRRMLIVTQSGLALSSLALAAVASMAAPPLILVFVIAFVHASVAAVDQPTRSAAIPRLVPPERLSAAIALNQLNFQIASITGPALGGLLIATIGLSAAYFVDAISFSASLLALFAISPLRPLADAARPGLRAIRDGFAFVRSRPIILSTFAIDLNAMIFGMPASLFPILALEVFDAGPAGFGLLAAAPAAGAFVAALTSGWVTRVRRIGAGVIAMVAVWGLAITGFGIACVLAGVAPADDVRHCSGDAFDRRRSRCPLGGAARHDHPARDAGPAAWPGDVDPAPRRHQRTADWRHRGRRGRGRDRAVPVGAVGWRPVPRRPRRRGPPLPDPGGPPEACLNALRRGRDIPERQKTITWRTPSPLRIRSNAASTSPSSIRRSTSEPIGSRPARARSA